MVFDPTDMDFYWLHFEKHYFTHSVYEDLKEKLPQCMLDTIGMGSKRRVYIDSKNAGESLTNLSRTVFLYYSTVQQYNGCQSRRPNLRI